MEVFRSDERIICLDTVPTCYLKPCGHMSCCSSCLAILAARGDAKCPTCRRALTSVHTLEGVASEMDRVAQAAVAMTRAVRQGETGFTFFGSAIPVRQTDDIQLDYGALYPSLMTREVPQRIVNILEAYMTTQNMLNELDQMPPLEQIE